jgi:hypothetical protein
MMRWVLHQVEETPLLDVAEESEQGTVVEACVAIFDKDRRRCRLDCLLRLFSKEEYPEFRSLHMVYEQVQVL